MKLPSICTLALATLGPTTWGQPLLVHADGQGPNESHKVIASDGAANDIFGVWVSVSGTTAIVGAPLHDSLGVNSGAAYLFNTSTGEELAKLLHGGGMANDQFGRSVAISGTNAVVGAIYADNSDISNVGAAYVFDTTTGTQTHTLIPGDGVDGDNFGNSIAISGNIAIVGSKMDDDNGNNSGSAYLFNATTGTLLAKLLPSDGSGDDRFGYSVGISGTTAIVGAFWDDDNGSNSGSAYIFDVSDPTAPVEIAKLLPADGEPGNVFGYSVAISGNIAIVGAEADNDRGPYSGSAYLYNANTGAQLFKLLPADGVAHMHFGISVAISGDTAIVGALQDFQSPSGAPVGVGSAYLFDTTTGTQTAKLRSSDGAEGDHFGVAVAISGNNVIVGAETDDDNGMSSGSAYIFDTNMPPGEPFCHGDGTGSPCPCGNTGASGEGCANDSGSGAQLTGTGSNSLIVDDLVLTATNLTNGPGLFFQGNNAVNSGNGNPFGDGLRCAGFNVVRLEVQFSSAGTSSTSISIADRGGVSAGDTKRYQIWYRDSGGSPCNSGFNLTNGYEITWTP